MAVGRVFTAWRHRCAAGARSVRTDWHAAAPRWRSTKGGRCVRTWDELLHDPDLHDPDASPDYANGISSKVVRCRYDGRRAVAVGADLSAKAQIGALVDLLDLHLSVPPTHRGVDVHRTGWPCCWAAGPAARRRPWTPSAP